MGSPGLGGGGRRTTQTKGVGGGQPLLVYSFCTAIYYTAQTVLSARLRSLYSRHCSTRVHPCSSALCKQAGEGKSLQQRHHNGSRQAARCRSKAAGARSHSAGRQRACERRSEEGQGAGGEGLSCMVPRAGRCRLLATCSGRQSQLWPASAHASPSLALAQQGGSCLQRGQQAARHSRRKARHAAGPGADNGHQGHLLVGVVSRHLKLLPPTRFGGACGAWVLQPACTAAQAAGWPDSGTEVPWQGACKAYLSGQARDKGHQAQRHRRLHKAELRGQSTGAEAHQTEGAQRWRSIQRRAAAAAALNRDQPTDPTLQFEACLQGRHCACSQRHLGSPARQLFKVLPGCARRPLQACKGSPGSPRGSRAVGDLAGAHP